MSDSSRNIVLGITGGSGAIYAVRLLEVLTASGWDVHLSISPSGKAVIQQELALSIDLENFTESDFLSDIPGESKVALLRNEPSEIPSHDTTPSERTPQGKLHYHHYRDMMAPIASGSFLTKGMVVCPCSGGTLSAIAHAASDNLIRRAAEVHLKERRRLILVPRETPLSLPNIENLRSAALAGAVILPASPGWYHGVTHLRDLVDFLVARVCDQLAVEHRLIPRWGSD